MVFMLSMEFLAPSDDEEEVVLSDQVAQLALDPMMVVFEKPIDDERQHLKALFVKDRVDGQPVSKILIDGGAAINIMPYVMYQKLGRGYQDLTKTDMMLKDFEGNVSPAKGAVYVELTISSKTLPTTFFVIMVRVRTIYFQEGTGFMPIVVFLPQCINASHSGLGIRLRLSLVILLISSNRKNQILMSKPNAYQEKFRRNSSSELPTMKFHRSKQSVLKRSFNG
jgi:hypothetical protein